MTVELRAELERFQIARRRRFDTEALLRATASTNIDALWLELASRPYLASTSNVDARRLGQICPDEPRRISAAADRVLQRVVDLLGSGPTRLGQPIDWLVDFKTGTRWALGYGRRIEYTQLGRPSDVKVPWELSRLQWALPAGQAYLLTGDDRYAAAVRDILDEWIAANPYGWSVNWAVTMEVALRILSWTWLFHVFKDSTSWSEAAFRSRFLRTLYLHCVYAERNLERAEVNGNHYTADAAGLAVGGMFFGSRPNAVRWSQRGWAMLEAELPGQVHPDGVDFEASTAYHRLVTELFFLPALYRTRLGLRVDASYRDRVADMARFAVAYCRPDGTSPLVGDADDGRALPVGGQTLGDHRYLGGLLGAAWGIEDLRRSFSGPRSEVAWLLGLDAAEHLPRDPVEIPSRAFPDAGFYVMRGPRDHVFVDCGPVGFAGRGGHGHNDCLSFEAMLDSTWLVADSGAFVYTADYLARNRFRATAAHNTPMIDREEQNRFVRPEYLWLLHFDAAPKVLLWRTSGSIDVLRARHDGYLRLSAPVVATRTVVLDRERHVLVVRDEFEGSGEHLVQVPIHLAPDVQVMPQDTHALVLAAGDREFVLAWSEGDDWHHAVRPSLVSPSYGLVRQRPCVELSRLGVLRSLTVTIAPRASMHNGRATAELLQAASWLRPL
jgi:uncharacterized heparinase superfamily protein